MDRIRIIPADTYLTDEAVDRSTTVAGFSRKHHCLGKAGTASIVLSLELDGSQFIRIIAHRIDDGRWRVSCIDVNLPAHLHGHNGRPIRTQDELALALTRVRHFASMVIRPECVQRIIPGVGNSNLSFLQYVEAMIQVQDHGHALLLGSHVAHMSGRHTRPLICWGSYTCFKGQALALKIYDKAAQRKSGRLDPELIDATRLEVTLRTPRRLAMEAAATGIYTGSPGEVVKTLSLETAYAILRRTLHKLCGYGLLADASLTNLSSTARHLLLGLGARIGDPHAVDQMLEHYRQTSAPGHQTLSNVARQVRSYALNKTAPDAHQLIQSDMNQLKWSNLRVPMVEMNFKALLRDTKAPMEPAPDILDAWATTTFLPKKPAGFELSGQVAPSFYAPWKQTL